jgi:hypothetical protein
MNIRMNKFLGVAAAGAAVLALSACLLPTGDGEGLGPSGDVLPPDTNFTFVYATVFENTCTGCHGNSPTGDALNLRSKDDALGTLFGAGGANRLTTAAQTENPRWRVYRTSDSTGIADSSYIYVKLLPGTPKNGARMPLTGGYLTNEQIHIVKRWIEQGARF